MLLDIEKALPQIKALCMEACDCATACLEKCEYATDPLVAFKDVDYAVLCASAPTPPDMKDRKVLLEKNKLIFESQGRAMQAVGKASCRVVVVGNPMNTNAAIFLKSAPKLQASHVTALTRLDHNRLLGQVASRLGVSVKTV